MRVLASTIRRLAGSVAPGGTSTVWVHSCQWRVQLLRDIDGMGCLSPSPKVGPPCWQKLRLDLPRLGEEDSVLVLPKPKRSAALLACSAVGSGGKVGLSGDGALRRGRLHMRHCGRMDSLGRWLRWFIRESKRGAAVVVCGAVGSGRVGASVGRLLGRGRLHMRHCRRMDPSGVVFLARMPWFARVDAHGDLSRLSSLSHDRLRRFVERENANAS